MATFPRSAALRLLVLCGSLAVLAIGTATARSETVWDMYVNNAVATTVGARGELAMIKRIEQETHGQLKIKFHLAGSLPIKLTNNTQAVADGVVQLAEDGFFQGNIRIGGLTRLPMLIRTRAEFEKALKIVRPDLDKQYAVKGVLILGEFTYPPQVPFSRRKLTTLADIKGQKLRVTSPEQGEFVRRFGGTSVTMGANAVPAAIDRGVIDGAFTAASGAGYTWRDLIKYNYKLGINYFDSYIIVNKAAFDKLSPEIQKKLRTIVAETVPELTTQLQQQDNDLTHKMVTQNGMILTQPTAQELAEATKVIAPYWEIWAKAHGADAVAALAKVRAGLGR